MNNYLRMANGFARVEISRVFSEKHSLHFSIREKNNGTILSVINDATRPDACVGLLAFTALRAKQMAYLSNVEHSHGIPEAEYKVCKVFYSA